MSSKRRRQQADQMLQLSEKFSGTLRAYFFGYAQGLLDAGRFDDYQYDALRDLKSKFDKSDDNENAPR